MKNIVDWLLGRRGIVKQVEMYPGKDGEWRWRLRAWNGEKVGDDYSSKEMCEKSAKAVAKQLGTPLKET